MQSTWKSENIGGKHADVYEPAGPGRARFGLLYLHSAGLETLRDQPVYTHWLETFRLACVCPHGEQSWWADRVCPVFDPALTPERHILQNVMPEFQRRWGLEPRSIGLLGISMGGQGALRLAFKHPQLFPVVAGISSALDYYEWYGQGLPLDTMYDSKEQCRQDTALLHIHPSQFAPHIFFCIDPVDASWYRGNDRLHEKLNALGITHTADLTTQAGGHSWDYFNHMAERAIRFIVKGLEEESRRLL